jgi:flagellar hook-associated protein 1 FlgK
MTSLLGLLRLGYAGVQAQRALTEVAGQNIANASTPGYRRQSAVLATLPGAGLGGVRVTGLLQARDTFLARELLGSRSALGHEQALRQTLQAVEPYLDDVQGAGLSDALTGFFGAVGRLSENPGNGAARTAVLSAARTLAARVRQAAGGLSEGQRAAQGEVAALVTEANGDLARVAVLNREIAKRGMDGAAAALRDERDRLVQGLAEALGAAAIEDTDGSATLIAAGGQVLVQGDLAQRIELTPAPGAAWPVLSVRHGSEPAVALAGPVGGRLGGLLAARDEVFAGSLADLDRFAFDFAGAVNAAHAAGFGADGVSGRALFGTPAGVAGAAAGLTVALDDPLHVAAAGTLGGLPGDNSVLLTLQGLAQDRGFAAGGGTPGDALGAVGDRLARRLADARAGEEAEQALLAQIEALHAERTGVSIEEELVAVTAAQRAFEASARTVKAADELMQTVLNLR